METLASILAGQGSNPYQQAGQGIAPLLSQFLLNQNLAQGQLGGQQQPATTAQQAPMGLGMMPQANPQAAALLQAIQSGQTPGTG